MFASSHRLNNSSRLRRSLIALAAIACLVAAAYEQPFLRFIPSSEAVSSTIVISQVYGGGGNAGSTLTNDFIELFNRGNTTVSLNGWSVQYGAATGTTWQVTNLTNVSLAPGQYYLIQEAVGAGGTTPLPTPDATATIAMAAGAGKVALVNTTTALSGACPTGASIVDFVGYGTTANCFEGSGPTPAPSNTTSVVRGSNGCTETDNNASDFAASPGVPVPHNTASTLAPCGGGGSTSPTGVGAANPNPVMTGNTTLLTVTVTPGTNPASTGITVTGDLTSIGGSATQTFFDNATNGDVTAGDNIFSFLATVAMATTGGVKTLPISIADAQARTGSTSISLTVQTPPVAVHDIQGSGNTSPLVNSVVTTSGIVTGRKSNGFFLQTPDAFADANPNTSEGVFVFTSSAPPAAAAVGSDVTVTGTVQEFIPSTDPASPPQTEIAVSPSVSSNSTGNALPAAITITAADTLVNDVNNLEKYEGMRVHVDSLTVGAPTGGNIDEANATSSSFGDFYGVITGVARPFREPGLEVPYPTPTPWPSGSAPASIQVFDANPERLRVNSLGLTGATDLQVATGAVVTGITGPLDYGFRTYTIDPDPPPATVPTVTGGMSAAVPAPTPTNRELTIASFNLERFFDTTDDPSVSDVALTATAYANRKNKASLAIRNVLNLPDVLGVEEVENLTTLQDLATKINADEVAASRPNPNYTASLSEGNDIGGIDVGFLVKSSRVSTFSVTQYNKTETFNNPTGGPADILNDRPPLVLRASITQPNGSTLFFSVVVNHLRSLGSVTLTTTAGAHTRVKRQKEAESLATLINEMQNGGARQVLPYDQNIVSVGDYNAFQFNDGYNDVIGTIKGTPAPSSQVVESSPDLNNPDLTDLIDLLPADQKYSYTFGGNAQAIDHTLVNQNMLNRFSRFVYPRVDADFPDVLRNDPNRPERISDHDPQVAYFNMAIVPTAAPAVISGQVTATDGTPLAGVTMTLSGGKSAKTVTDGMGYYRFTDVQTDSLYSVAPSRANYSFTPQSRSFSLLADKTDAVFTANAESARANPLDDASFFVRQQYVDFLNREPDQDGFDY
ncbi:MAG: lamin tail domain-containing protein, partial [Pyrinomonadaceae bacterium]